MLHNIYHQNVSSSIELEERCIISFKYANIYYIQQLHNMTLLTKFELKL